MLLKLSMVVFAFLFMFSSVICFAQEPARMRIAEMVFCESVEERDPINSSISFPDNIGELYCYTWIEGAPEATSVIHVWYYGDEEMSRISLKVGANSWRTWSSKKILESWKGKWRVDVLISNGDLLGSQEFTIKSVSDQQ